MVNFQIMTFIKLLVRNILCWVLACLQCKQKWASINHIAVARVLISI